jgi:alpha-methylacyl-CoA racemase
VIGALNREAGKMSGPLWGLRVIELGGIGPVPHAGMLLADLGADVVRVERPTDDGRRLDHTFRGRRIVKADLKSRSGVGGVLALAETADVLLEGFRPGVSERLTIFNGGGYGLW